LTCAPFAGPFNISSHEIQKYFRKYKITPFLDDRYSSYFVKRPAEIALTYEWNTRFHQIKEFLDPGNIALHNCSLNPVASVKDRLYLMSFAWTCFGTIPSIPENIEECTIFVDIFLNDQNTKNIQGELDSAELRYRKVPLHIVLGTSRVFSRAWCLYEVAVRTESRKRIQLLLARGPEGQKIPQIPPVRVGPVTIAFMVMIRALWVPYIPMWISFQVLRVFYRKDLAKVNSISEMTSLGTIMTFFQNFLVEEEREFARANFFDNMDAFLAADKDAIKGKILHVFRSQQVFNAMLKSTVVHSGNSALALTLIYWLEALVGPLFFPIHLLTAFLALMLALAPIPSCCTCANGGQLLAPLDLDQRTAKVIEGWIVLDVVLKPGVFAIIAAPLVLILAVGRCVSAARRRYASRSPSDEKCALVAELGNFRSAEEWGEAGEGAGRATDAGAGGQPREVTSVRAFFKGFVPGFRVWTLEAYDGGERVARVSVDLGSNQRKMRAFCEEVERQGYALRPAHVAELSATLYLNLEWDNSNAPFRDFIRTL
jgi:hypothetical protein